MNVRHRVETAGEPNLAGEVKTWEVELAMGFQTVSDARFAVVDGHRLLVRCYDPDTGEVVALLPSDVAEDPDATGHFVAASIPRRHRPGEYAPEDSPAGWPLNGPCPDLPAN